MSILPSLLTSAAVAPSERKAVSMTVFFQRTAAGFSWASVERTASSSRAGANRAGSQARKRMGGNLIAGGGGGGGQGPGARLIIGTCPRACNSPAAGPAEGRLY